MTLVAHAGQVSIGALQQQIGPSIGNPVIGWCKMVLSGGVTNGAFYVNNTVETTMVFPYAMRADCAYALPNAETDIQVPDSVIDGNALTLNVNPTAVVSDDSTHGHGSKITVTAPGEDGAEEQDKTYWVIVFGSYAAASMVQET